MIDPIAFELGFFSIRWYGLIIGTAIILAFLIILKLAKVKGIDQEFILDFFLVGIPAGIIGARLYFVIFKAGYYLNNPSKIFAFWEGGLAIHGAIIVGIIVLYLMAKKRGVSFFKTGDVIVPALALGQAIGRWGNFINREAHGGIVSESFINIFPDFIKNQMLISGNYYNPTFFYEFIWDFLIFLALIYLFNKVFLKDGDLIFIYLIVYSFGRFFIEIMRTDALMMGSFRVAQLISILLIIISTVFLYYRHQSKP